MGLAVGGLQSAGTSTAGTSTTALKYTSTQVSGQDGFAATTAGARWHIGPGTTDYLSSNGTTGINAAGDLSATGRVTGNNGVTCNSGNLIVGGGADASFGNRLILTNYADGSGTPGSAVNDKVRGRNAFAIGAATCVITTSYATATCLVLVTLEFVDVTLTQILTVVPAIGSFTVTGNAIAAAATRFGWVIIQ